MGELITTNTDVLVKIRWALDKDLSSCAKLDIDDKYGWEISDFKKFKKADDNISLIAELGNQIVGYAMVSLLGDRIKVAKLTVCELLRRKTIGSQLIDRMKYGFLKKQRTCIFTEVDEYNVIAQLFFQFNGFRANEIKNDCGAQIYLMQYYK
jgi:ribosomal protein S18 acetylase RimI-like enzyme